ncbi:MAG: helix-turn-helix transcriptional regulator [Bacteroidales bacterium]
MNKEELLQTKGYWVAKIQIELYNQLSDYMRKNELNRTQLAAKLGVTKGYVSQILNGDFNHRISTLVELSLAMGKAPVIQFSDLDQIHDDMAYDSIPDRKVG